MSEVRVTRGDLENVRDEGSVLVVTGTDEADGARVTFAGDRRPLLAFLEAAADSDAGAVADVENWQVLHVLPLRRGEAARRNGTPSEREVAAYLPNNYQVTSSDEDRVSFAGHDVAGWTLEDYVLPRLASGLISAWEVTP